MWFLVVPSIAKTNGKRNTSASSRTQDKFLVVLFFGTLDGSDETVLFNMID